jgi:AcrR family transcriptional regulator
MNDRSPPPLRTRLRALAAEAILDAAEEVFAEQGLQAGMDAIASRAGVAVGTIYNHFGDRESLLRALMRAHHERILAAIDEACVRTAGKDVREQLVAAIDALAVVTEKHAAFRRRLLQVDPPLPSAEKHALGDALAARFAELLKPARDAGLLTPDPTGMRPVLLLGLVHSTLMLHLRDPERLPADRIAVLVADQFLDGARVRA